MVYVFVRQVLLWSPGWPEVHYIDQGWPWIYRDLCLSLLWPKAYATTPSLPFGVLLIYRIREKIMVEYFVFFVFLIFKDKVLWMQGWSGTQDDCLYLPNARITGMRYQALLRLWKLNTELCACQANAQPAELYHEPSFCLLSVLWDRVWPYLSAFLLSLQSAKIISVSLHPAREVFLKGSDRTVEMPQLGENVCHQALMTWVQSLGSLPWKERETWLLKVVPDLHTFHVTHVLIHK